MFSRIHLNLVRAATTIAAVSAMGIAFISVTTPAPAQYSLTHDDFGDGDDDQPCMSSSRLRSFIADKGYTGVKLNSSSEPWYVHAVKGGSVYQLVVSTCSGSIVGRQRVGTT